jgi:glutamate racemase
MPHPAASSPIGVFDSGVGGLSVLRALWSELPHERWIYLADQAHVPYGPRPLLEVRSYAAAISRYLLEQRAKLIVVACNAASAAALHHLRATFPGVPFVGMEPAVKPAAEGTVSRIVGVLATPATFQGELYASLVERFANGVTLLKNTCPGLVAQIESGDLDGPQTRLILEAALHPMLAAGIDTVVLGCTHYPFVIPLIQQITGPQVRVIDPAPAVARQARRLLTERGLLGSADPTPASPQTRFLTTGDPRPLASLLPRLIGINSEVASLLWQKEQGNPLLGQS